MSHAWRHLPSWDCSSPRLGDHQPRAVTVVAPSDPSGTPGTTYEQGYSYDFSLKQDGSPVTCTTIGGRYKTALGITTSLVAATGCGTNINDLTVSINHTTGGPAATSDSCFTDPQNSPTPPNCGYEANSMSCLTCTSPIALVVHHDFQVRGTDIPSPPSHSAISCSAANATNWGGYELDCLITGPSY